MGLRGRAAALAVFSVAAVGHGPYAYDTHAPLAYKDAGRINGKYPIAVHDVSYTANGKPVKAYLTLPPKSVRNVPAVLYLHGAGEDRRRFLLPAAWLAGRRAVGMTITLPSSLAGKEPLGLTPQQRLDRSRRIFVADVIAVRRAVDLLQRLPQVDRSRIGLVGWSLGARVGAVAAGAEPRLRAVVLMSGGASPVSDFVKQAPPSFRKQVRAELTTIDPLRWIARSHAPILLQDGRKDTVVPRAALDGLARAAPAGTVLRWYPTDHALNAQAYKDQLAFLAKHLPIRGPNVRGADTGP
jgi:dienelactone hydrolase